MAKKTIPTPREYTMPNDYQQGGFATYNPQTDRMENAQLIGEDILRLKAKRAGIQKELDDLKVKRQNFDILSVNVPEKTEDDNDDIQAQQFRAGAEALMEYDPGTAQGWLLRADDIDEKKQNRLDKLASKDSQFTPGTKEWVNWMTSMLKQKTYEAGLYTGQAREDLLAESANIKRSLSAYPMGRSALGIAEPIEPGAPVQQTPPPGNGNGNADKVKTSAEWEADINKVDKNTPNWQGVLSTYKTTIANALDTKELGSNEANALQDKITKRINDINTAIKAPAIATAKEKAEAKAWVSTFLTSMRLNDLVEKARAARSALNSIVSEVRSGHYANANLKPFKETMGAMSAGEYGIATDSPAAAMAAAIPLVGEGIATWIASDKFNDEKTAIERTNAAIKAFNELITVYTAANMLPKGNSTPARVAALSDSPVMASMRVSLGSPIKTITKTNPGGTTPPAVTPAPGSMKDLFKER